MLYAEPPVQVVTELEPPFTIVHVNDAWCQLTGFSAHVARGRTSAILQAALHSFALRACTR